MKHLGATLSPGAKEETLSSDNRRKGRWCQTYLRLRNWREKSKLRDEDFDGTRQRARGKGS